MTDQMNEKDWYSDASATFGDRLSAAREARDMSRSMLAKRLGVAGKTIENWEEDRSEPRANKLQMVAGLLDVSLPWLLTGQGQGVVAREVPAARHEVDGLLDGLRTARAEMQRAAERMAVLEKRLRQALSA